MTTFKAIIMWVNLWYPQLRTGGFCWQSYIACICLADSTNMLGLGRRIVINGDTSSIMCLRRGVGNTIL